MNPEVAAKIDEIRRDRSHGAGWLSRQALAVLKLAAQRGEATTCAALCAELREVARELMAARPAMAPLTNSVAHFLCDLWQRTQPLEELGSFREVASVIADALVAALEQAALAAAKKGAEAIAEGERVLTCSYSATVCQAFGIAREGGRHFAVLVAESRFEDRAYGRATAEQLEQSHIPVEIIPDAAIRQRAPRANKALVGADSILSDGSLINGSPTYELALAAREHNLPFYVLCDTAKFSLSSEAQLEEGFEQIPSRLITGIITEQGTIRPEEVFDVTADLRERVGLALPGYSMGK